MDCTGKEQSKRIFWFAIWIVMVIMTVVTYMNANYLIDIKVTLPKLKSITTDSHKQTTVINYQHVKVQNATKLILLWRPLYKTVKFLTETLKKNCPSLPCTVSGNKALLSKADAVAVEVESIESLPKKGKMGQVWIYIDMEAPTYLRNGLKKWDYFFNWTLSYRRDSDFVTEYVSIPDMRTISESAKGQMNKKRNRMSWLVSHCQTAGKREQYVKELQKHFSVDIYGRCGKAICRKGKECENNYIQNYKFFLAAENSNCRDYVTEKIVRPFTSATLPIVKGSSNYSLYVPPNSVIDASDFSSPRALANYLKIVSNNNSLYKYYFAWQKNSPINGVPGYNAYCDICRKLHNPDKYRRLYRSIHDWWRGNKENAGEYFCNEEELVRL